MSEPSRALERLKEPDSVHVQQLADLLTADLRDTPMVELVPPQWLAERLRVAVVDELQSDTLREWLTTEVQRTLERWNGDERPLETWMPESAHRALREALSQPWTPDPDLTHRLLDQGAIRHLLKAVLEHTVMGFARRVRDLEKGVLGGVGSKAIKRGKGLLGGARGSFGGVSSRLGGVTSVAGSLVGAVRDEVEASLERRVKGFVVEALGDAVRVLANTIASDTFARPFADLRVGAVQVVLETPLDRWAAEGRKLDVEALLDVVREGLQAQVIDDDTFASRTAEFTRELLGDDSLGTWLQRWGVHSSWTDSVHEITVRRINALAKTEEFAKWWDSLHC